MSVNIKGVLKGAAVSLVITFVLLLIVAALSYFTSISESAVTIGAYAAVIIGVLAGSILIARAAPNKKLIHALLVCAVYTAALTAVSAAMNGSLSFNAHTLAVVGGIFAAAFLGAVIGNKQ